MNRDLTAKKCDILLLLVLLAPIFGVSTQISAVLDFLFLSYIIIIRKKGKILFPPMPGLKAYLFFIFYAAMVGMLLNTPRNVLRDLFYVLPTVFMIFVGMQYKEEDTKKSLFKTLFFYGAVISIKCLIQFFLNIDLSFDNLRSVFGTGVYDVGFILPLYFYCVYINRQRVFSSGWDKFFIVIMTLQILLCFGRIGIIGPLVMICILLVICSFTSHEKAKIFRIISFILILIIIALLFMFYFLPESTIGTLVEKFSGSFQEIDSTQIISSTSEAMNHWRAYEIQAAQQQWGKQNLIIQMFGEGMGKGTEMEYIPYSWNYLGTQNEIPLLHNGFYTLLSKGGLFAFASLLWIFVGAIVQGIKCVFAGPNKQSYHYGVILVALNVVAILNTWVVRGPVQQGAFAVWALLVGYIYSNKK